MTRARRRLNDLYVMGREVRFDDGTPCPSCDGTGQNNDKKCRPCEGRGNQPIVVWLQKLTPVERDSALKKANAERARVLAAVKDKDSDDWVSAEADALEIGDRDSLLEFLIDDEVAKLVPAREAELAAEKEWADEDYYSGLIEAWDDKFKQVYFTEEDVDAEEKEEAERIWKEMNRFSDQLEEKLEGERAAVRRDLEDLDDNKIVEKVARRLVDAAAGSAWLREFRMQQVSLATREPDNHHKKYFESRDELNHLHMEVLSRLISEYTELEVDPLEGKGSAPNPDSSSSSEQPEAPETEPSSGLSAVPA